MRLKNLNNADLETMIEATAIRYRVKCDEINNVLIRQTLQAEFAAMLVIDFNNAFIKHCAGKFVISEKPDNNKPYGDLSCLFICDVLKAFKIYKAKEIAKPQLAAPISKQLEMNTATKEELQKEHYEIINDWYNKHGEVPLLANWNEAFIYMWRTKIIVIDADEVEMFKDLVVYNLNAEIKKLKVERANYGHLKNIVENPGLLRMECRKQFIIKYYNQKTKK